MYKQIILTGLILSSHLLYAQDLMDVYSLALQQDAEFKIAESEYQAVLETLPLAQSSKKPQVDFSSELVISESDNSTTGSNGRDSLGYSLDLSQALYNAQTLAAISAVEAKVVQARAELEVSRQDLIIRVAERYFDILAAQDNVEFANAEKNAIARQLEQATKRFEVGLIAITDVREAQARYDSTLALALLSENLLENAFQAMQVIIGESPSATPDRLGEQLELRIPEPAENLQWVEIALQNNQKLVAALAAMQAANFERQRKRKSAYPTLDLNASISDIDVKDGTLANFDQQDFRISIELNIPLFTGGRIDAELKSAEANFRSAQNAALLQRRLVSQQTSNAYLGLISGISQVQAFKQALSSSNTALEATEAGFKVGTRTSVDVLVSLQETYRAQRDYASARYDYLLNTLRLKQAAGLLSGEDLQRVNRWLVQ